MNSDWTDVIGVHRRIVRSQWVIVGILGLWGILITYGWLHSMSTLRVSLPPELRYGAVVAVGSIHPWEAYNFAGYIWQQLGTWHTDGGDEAYSNIMRLRSFLSESAYRKVLEDYQHRADLNELQGRVRFISPTESYRREKVTYVDDRWQVEVDQRVQEYLGDLKIKDQVFRFYLTVKLSSRDPERNPWQLVLDVPYKAPLRL